MIFFGIMNLFSSIQAIDTPEILEKQQNMMDAITKGIVHQELDSTVIVNDTIVESGEDQNFAFTEISKQMKEMMKVSDFSMKWIVRFGYVGIIIALVYLSGGLFLIAKNSFSISMAYFALSLNIVFSIVKTLVLSSDTSNSLMAMGYRYGEIFSLILDVVFIVIIFTSNKEAYKVEIESI